ncbi:MAG: hypothetical protein HC906_07925 [Bacteroidales bacterium]|nr:hypothetical protein [Bacteroidales bacterium]
MYYYLNLICIFFALQVSGQYSNSYYPVQYGQHIRYSSFINPASIGTVYRNQVMLGSKNYTGNFKSISSYFGGFYYSFDNEHRKPYSSLGILADSEREGKYIARTRGYLLYAYLFSCKFNVLYFHRPEYRGHEHER